MSLRDWFWWLPFGKVPEVKPEALHRQLDAGDIQLVDVRTRKEWRGGHIRGAINVPITEFRGRLDERDLDPERPVVAICLSAHRSIPAVRLLKRRGFARSSQLAGGMLAWRKAGLPEEREGG